MSPLPDLAHAYSMLLQEENQRELANTTTLPPENIAMHTKFTPSITAGNKSKFNRKLNDSANCDYCHLSGHNKEKCFALHGYPEWHRLHGQPKPKIRNSNGKKFNATANAVNTSVSQTTSPAAIQEPSDASNLSETQCQQLINMLQAQLKSSTPAVNASWISSASTSQMAGNCSSTSLKMQHVTSTNQAQCHSSNHTWIIDSEATHHITPYLSLIDNPTPLQSELHLPNGHSTFITHVGDIKLTSNITLKQVLYVPTFQCNLLSVAKFNIDNSCCIHFSSFGCIMQDHVMQRRMLIGKLEGGLYKMHTTTLQPKIHVSAAKVTSLDTIFLQWHNRLGHPSFTVLSHVPSLHNFSQHVYSDCDVCHKAKQVKLPYSASNSHSLSTFELIHCDVWGPYRHSTHGKCTYFLTIVEDFSKCTWLFLFVDKTQVPNLLKNFLSYVQNQFHKYVKVLRSI